MVSMRSPRTDTALLATPAISRLFHSDLHLILDSNVGFFVSYNSMGKGEIRPRVVLFEKFLDRYFPYTQPPAGKIENAKADAASIAGLYLTSRRFETSFLKLTSLLGQEKVFANPDGTISIDPFKGPDGQLLKFEEISPLLYREVHGRAHVGFKQDGNGQMQFQLDWPFFIFQKVGFWENKYFNYTLAIFGLAYGRADARAVASGSADSQTLWPSAGSQLRWSASCGLVCGWSASSLSAFSGAGWRFWHRPRSLLARLMPFLPGSSVLESSGLFCVLGTSSSA